MANIDIYGTLHNVTGEPIVTADQSKDTSLSKTQQELNALFNEGKNAQGEQVGKTYSSGNGVTVNTDDTISAKPSNGISVDADGIKAVAKTNGGLLVNADGIYVDFADDSEISSLVFNDVESNSEE